MTARAMALFLGFLVCAATAPIRPAFAQGKDTISGRVVSEAGTPFPGVELALTAAQWELSGMQRALSNEDGSFAFRSVRPGAYQISVTAPGYITEDEPRSVFYRPGDVVTIGLRKGGVITGTVTDENGQPVVGIQVRAEPVQENAASLRGRALGGPGVERTDDRGVYRLYGLRPDTYVVRAGGDEIAAVRMPMLHEGSAAVYHPGGPRSSATKVRVGAGDEVPGIDIRFRSDPGRTVAGTVKALGSEPATIYVHLIRADGAVEAMYIGRGPTATAFVFEAVGDGVYDVVARSSEQAGVGGRTSRRVVVKGADVRGVALTLEPLWNLEGRVRLAAAPLPRPAPCEDKEPPSVEAVVLDLVRSAGRAEGEANLEIDLPTLALPASDGAFRFDALRTGSYRLSTNLPSDDWYVDAVTVAASATAKPASVAEIAVGPAAPKGTLDVAIGRGAARIAGRVVAPEGVALPASVTVYLVPVAEADANNVWRHYEAVATRGGAFELKHLAPGAYWVLVRRSPDPGVPSPIWNGATRAAVRSEAVAANAKLELGSCQRAENVEAKFTPPPRRK